MSRRLAVLLAVSAALTAASPAPAQDNPFDPQLPAPTRTPAPLPAADEGDIGRVTLYAIGGALVIAFVGIGVWIARDARRSLPPEHRETGAEREAGPHRKGREAKAKARAKARRARAARKRNQR